jgi:type I restriction enzyme R subunit
MNEAETRAEHIDPILRAAGWGVVAESRIRRELQIAPGRLQGGGRRGKALIADYVLVYRNTQLAVIEAKRWDEPLTLGVGQAKNYAGLLRLRHAYSMNGQGIYSIDMHTGHEAEVDARSQPRTSCGSAPFRKPDAWRDRFAAGPLMKTRGGSWTRLRYYQEAWPSAEVMRSGGRRAVAPPADAGHRHRQDVHRVSDRVEAVRQPAGAWARDGRAPPAHPVPGRPQLPGEPGQRPQRLRRLSRGARPGADRARGDPQKRCKVPNQRQPCSSRSSKPSSPARPEKDGAPSPYFGEYPPDFFDFIIIDECHRGGAQRRELVARHPGRTSRLRCSWV